jgi:prenyltransferase beta subunit
LTYEGGISLIPGHPASSFCHDISSGAEAHGGSTFCALASLSIMGRLGSFSPQQQTGRDALQEERLTDEELTKILNWCLKR